MTIPYMAIVMVSRDFHYGFCQITKHQITVDGQNPMSILDQLVA